MDDLKKFITERFDVSEEEFLAILRSNHSAQGYILGAASEYLFQQYAEKLGYEVLRIKEKPKGGNKSKIEIARGDFYIRKRDSVDDLWYVVECKGVKSNAESRANLLSPTSWLSCLVKHSFGYAKHLDSLYNRGENSYLKKSKSWSKEDSFPPFCWDRSNPGPCVPNLSHLWSSKSEIEEWLSQYSEDDFSEEAVREFRSPLLLLQTHMPTERRDHLGIKSTCPLKSDFNILCVDLFIKTGVH